MKKVLVIFSIVVSLALMAASPAAAQFGGFGKKKEEKSGGGASQADVEVQQEKLVKSFVASQENLLQAQSLVADALGLKGEKEKLDAERKALGSGSADKKSLKRSVGLSEDVQKDIQERMDKGEALSDSGKKLIAQSLIPYSKSVAGVAGMVNDAKSLADGIQGQVKAAGMMGAMKVKKTFDVGLYIAPKVPGLAAGMTKQLASIVKFAKKNGVDIPSEATDLIP